MGQMTPDGVTEIQTSPQEQNPAAGFDVAPDPAISEFFNTLDNAVQEDPAAEDAIDLLIREIQETTGLYTDNPDMQAQAASRFEQLNSAIQDSNMPEEIKAAFNNIYTTSIDSPQYLNVLNGFIMQGGGSIAGIAGAAQRLEDERLAKRNEADNRAAAAGTAAMINTVQARIAADMDNFFEENAKWLRTVMNDACDAEKAHGSQAAADQVIEKTSPKLEELIAKHRQENPNATEEDIQEIRNQFAERTAAEAQDAGLSDEAVGLINNGLQTMGKNSRDIGIDNQLLFGTLMTSVASGHKLGTENSGIQSKEDLSNLFDQYFDETSAKLEKQRDELKETKEAYTTLEQSVNSIWGQTISFLGLNDEDQELMKQMESDIAEQEYILGLQEEINALSRTEIEDLLKTIDHPSEIDLDFLKQAVLNVNPELAAKTAELNELLGIESSNPIAQIQAILENDGLELTEQERAGLTDFITEVTAARSEAVDATEAREREAQILNDQAESNPDFVAVQHNNPPGMSNYAIATTGIEHVAIAIDAERDALSKLAALRLDVDIDSLPEFAVEQEAVFQKLSGRESIDQNEINEALKGLGLYGDNLAEANAHIAQSLTNEHGITVTGSLPPEEIKPPPPPAPIDFAGIDREAAQIAQELAGRDSMTHAELEQIVSDQIINESERDRMTASIKSELETINPDFEFAEMSVEEQIVQAFIENEGTLSQQDIELIISESGIDGAQFQTTVDAMIAKFDNHEAFSIDPPVGSAAAQYAPDLAAASEEPAPAETNEPEQDQAQQPEPEEQEYAHNQATQSPALY